VTDRRPDRQTDRRMGDGKERAIAYMLSRAKNNNNNGIMCVCIVCMLCCVYRPVFRSYQPQDDELKELQLQKPKPIEGL